jgi:myo-inositol-1(or 4)-monophosphatase
MSRGRGLESRPRHHIFSKQFCPFDNLSNKLKNTKLEIKNICDFFLKLSREMQALSTRKLYRANEGRLSMESKLDWSKILLLCKESVIVHTQPLRKTLNIPQPNLGRGAGGDPMKLVDLAAEKAIIDVLLENGVSFTLVSEESGIKEFGKEAKTCYVTVDPIDGTTNFVHELPFYCTSIAISNIPKLSQIHAAMVADLFHGTTYTAIKGHGALCDSRVISTSNVDLLEEAVLGLDLNTYKIKEIAPILSDLISQTKHLRHFGANALELCFVAQGMTDAFVDIRGKLRTTDVAAAFLILKEAGGIITDPDGNLVDADLDPKQTLKFVASANRKIHSAILSLIKSK